MAGKVKLKNHQNYMVNKKCERNVSYPGSLCNTTMPTLRSLQVCVLGRVANFWFCSPSKSWKNKKMKMKYGLSKSL